MNESNIEEWSTMSMYVKPMKMGKQTKKRVEMNNGRMQGKPRWSKWNDHTMRDCTETGEKYEKAHSENGIVK